MHKNLKAFENWENICGVLKNLYLTQLYIQILNAVKTFTSIKVLFQVIFNTFLLKLDL